VAYENEENLKIEVTGEYLLGSDEDAPMTLAVSSKGEIVTGINQAPAVIKERKQNKHLRIFASSSNKITPKLQKQVFTPSIPFDSEIYQRQTRFNGEENLLAISSTSGDISINSFPQLEQIKSMKADGDVLSVDFSLAENDTVFLLDCRLTQIAFVSPKTFQVFPFRESKRTRLQNKKTFNELHTAASQQFSSKLPKPTMSYRAIRFLSPTKILCAINERTSKKAYFGIYILNLTQGWRETLKPLPKRVKGVTSMDYSPSREMIAIATSEMSINVFNAETFAVCLSH
jgi:hypothetical protein